MANLPKADELIGPTVTNGQFKAKLKQLVENIDRSYATLAEANLDIANIGVGAKVDTDDSGLHYKATAGATSLTKSPYDPLTQAKDYTDQRFTLFDSSYFSNAGFISNTGVFTTHLQNRSTDYLKVIGGQKVSVRTIMSENRPAIIFFDADKVFIAYEGVAQTTLSTVEYTVPSAARYMRVVGFVAYTDVSNFSIKSILYDIDKIKAILQQHTPQLDPSKINYADTTVKLALDSVISKQNTIIANQSKIVGQLDLVSDKESPYFVNTSLFTRSGITPTNFDIVDVTARVSNNVMAVSDTTAFVYGSACVVYDAVANTYTSHAVLAVSGSNITVAPNLPSNPSKAQTMMDVANGQHLTLFGTKALADYTVSQLQKYSYKKAENALFTFNAALHCTPAWNNVNIYNADGTELVIPVTVLGTAGNGGFIAGTTNFAKKCAMTGDKNANLNIALSPHTQYLNRAYELKDGVAGNGFEISFDAQGSDGFIEIPLAVRDESYVSSVDSQTYRTSGKARLQVFNDSTLVHDAVYAAGQVHSIFVDFTSGNLIKIRVLCEESIPTFVALCGIFAYKKAKATSVQPLFDDGDVVAFLGDSWTQYPVATTIGETGQTRPDGSISTGSQWLSRRMKEKLQTQSKNATMLNMGFGGQTSRWGKYWVNTIITLEPKPTHCVLCFYINDRNGIETPSATAYDFDPSNMFINKTVVGGGVDGRVRTYDEWESNLKWLCEKLSANGIKPIVIMPSHTAAASQAQGIRQNQLGRIADGFN